MISTAIPRHFLRIALAALCGVLLLSGCALIVGGDNGNNNSGGNDGVIAGVDSTSYNTAGSYSIRIRNESNRDLVAFKSSLSKDNILGAVPKQANNHGFKLKTDSHMFPPGKSHDFSIIFLTKEDYEQYKDSLVSREQSPFTRIFAAYNASGTNDTPWTVSGRLGGENKLIISNSTKWDMELRENSPRGITLGYAPHEVVQTTLYMNQGDVYIFPVFKQYNGLRDEIISISPRDKDGKPSGDSFSFKDGNTQSISADKFLDNNNMTSGMAYLLVYNASQQGISVYNGNEPQTTTTGIAIINSGETRSFPILMDGSAETTYETSKSISGWKIVQMWREKPIQADSPLEADYRYTVEVSGDWSLGEDHVTVSAPKKGENKFTNDIGPGI
jgi:hypothetical protein